MRSFIALVLAFSMSIYLGCGSGSSSAPKQATEAQFEKITAKGSTGGNNFDDEAPLKPTTPKPAPAAAAATDKKPAAQPGSAKNQASTPSNAFNDEVVAENPAPKAAVTTSAESQEGSAKTESAAPGDQAKSRAAAPSNAFNDEETPVSPSAPANPTAAAGSTGNAAPNSAPVGPGALRGGKNSRMQASAAGNSDSDSGEYGNNALAESKDPVDVEPKSFMEKAVKSFGELKESDASQYLYAHWVTQPDTPKEFPIQWVSGISEPRLFFRWGVGVVYDAPDGFDGQPPLIGGSETVVLDDTNRGGRSTRSQTPVSPGTRVNRGARLAAPAEKPAADPVSPGYEDLDRSLPMGDLIFHTGDFGERLIKRLNSRRLHKDAFYGRILATGGLNDWDWRRGVGSAPVVAAAANPGGFNARGGGDIDETPVPNSAAPNRSRNDATNATTDPTEGTLLPGVIYLGVTSGSDAEKSILEKGKANGLDAVLIFYVSVREKGRTKTAYSSTMLGVHNLKTGDSQKTGSLSSETVAKTREKSRDEANDPVELALDKIFKDYSDEKLRVSAMPELKPEVVMKRVDTLTAGTYDNPLPIIAEIVSYNHAGLLDEVSAVSAVAKLVGNDEAAQKLITGSAEEKQVAIEKWLPGKTNAPQNDASFR